jgi:hypothetical protein
MTPGTWAAFSYTAMTSSAEHMVEVIVTLVYFPVLDWRVLSSSDGNKVLNWSRLVDGTMNL